MRRNVKFLNQQKLFVTGLMIGLVILVAYLSITLFKDTPTGTFLPGVHYIELDKPYKTRGNKIEVIEFFSYACIVCYRFDPMIAIWAKENEDIVKFLRSPLSGNETWRRMAQHYYALERLEALEDNHDSFFHAVHKKKLTISSPARLAKWAEEQSILEYEEALQSIYIKSKLTSADQLARRLKIASVPALLVNGKYSITISDKVGTTRMLEILDYLVKKDLNLEASVE